MTVSRDIPSKNEIKNYKMQKSLKFFFYIS